MRSRNLQLVKDLTIAAGRPDIGTGARLCYQMDGRASKEMMHPERSSNKHSLQIAAARIWQSVEPYCC
jgi:hypothetical protein